MEKSPYSYEMSSHRLSGDQIRLVYKTGFRIKENGLFLYALESPDGTLRLAEIVRKKLYKKAVDRNRVKRSVREALRTSGLFREDRAYWFVFDLRSWNEPLEKNTLFHLSNDLLKMVR